MELEREACDDDIISQYGNIQKRKLYTIRTGFENALMLDMFSKFGNISQLGNLWLIAIISFAQ